MDSAYSGGPPVTSAGGTGGATVIEDGIAVGGADGSTSMML